MAIRPTILTAFALLALAACDDFAGGRPLPEPEGPPIPPSPELPMTTAKALAIIDGLLVGIGDDRYIIPTLSVCESFRPRAGMISTVHERGEMISVRGRQTPLLRLGNHLGVKSRAASIEEGIIVVVESGGASRALLVDQLIGKQEVVIKSLGRAFENQNLVAGGAVLGDGWVGLILDVDTLVKLPLDNRAGQAPPSTGTHA